MLIEPSRMPIPYAPNHSMYGNIFQAQTEVLPDPSFGPAGVSDRAPEVPDAPTCPRAYRAGLAAPVFTRWYTSRLGFWRSRCLSKLNAVVQVSPSSV